MRRILFLLAGLGVLALLGLQVRDAEALIASGEVVLLDLAPVDPRSLMQGDYMRLSFAIERQVKTSDDEGADPAPAVILALDDRRVGTFRRFAAEGGAGPGEQAFRVRRDGTTIRIEPHSFLFQEGRADDFAKAKFGIFRVDASGRHLLVGLADAEAKRIDPQ
jgi:uncharacterized membrane-anchored protein